MESFIHHIEWCVENLEETEKILSDKYGFKLISQRDIYHSSLAYSDRNIITVSQKVLQSGKTVFILTKNNCQKEGTVDVGQNASYPSFTCCSYEKEHKRDSVFNICLEVKDVDAITKRIIEYDDEGEAAIVTQPTNIYYGENCRLRFSVVRSKCGNIIHTLINTQGYRQAKNVPFLPGFVDINEKTISSSHQSANKLHPLTSFIDHVTYVCHFGESKKILDWYKSCFGMERFLISEAEKAEDEGVEIGGDVGMRLTVGKWISSWMCREEGVKFGDSECNAEHLNFKLVLAEPMEGYTNCHVQQFIDAHGGPGIQHIGLTVVKNISEVVRVMTQCGADFRKPPPAYYTLDYKRREILELNESVYNFQSLGLLIDTEVDFCNSDNEDKRTKKTKEKNVLIQVFTKPIFKENTFFLEILERRGARGFGAGNITALAKSIILQEKTTS